MNKSLKIGHWYTSTDMKSIFEIVSYNDIDHCYEIQLFDGEIDAIDEEYLLEINLCEIQQPEDWSGAIELPDEEMMEYLEDPKNSIGTESNSTSYISNDIFH